ncbi:MAG: threonine ammonia-lyase [Dehalococcoidia bacterium]
MTSPPLAPPQITLDDIVDARERARSLVRHTPLLHSAALSEMTGCDIWFKAECLQRTGSFKVRGAGNRIALLTAAERQRGVVAASAGNHAQGVAIAASAAGVEATIVMPTIAPLAKVEATRSYGAQVVLVGQDYAAAAEYAHEVSERAAGPILIHAFNDAAVIAGQGTLGLEILEDTPDVANVVIPVGGGGLAGGTGLALKTQNPAIKVYGVQAAAARGVAQSLIEGRLVSITPGATLADGVAVSQPGELTLPLLQRHLDGMATVDEEEISQAIVFMLERSKLVVEGAGAIGVAAAMHAKLKLKGKTVIVLTGGNLDINVLARIVEHGLTHAGRYFDLRVGLDDRPGRLSQLLQSIADGGANVISVEHQRAGIDLAVGRVAVDLILEVRSRTHGEELVGSLCKSGFVRTTDDKSLHLVPADWQ